MEAPERPYWLRELAQPSATLRGFHAQLRVVTRENAQSRIAENMLFWGQHHANMAETTPAPELRAFHHGLEAWCWSERQNALKLIGGRSNG